MYFEAFVGLKSLKYRLTKYLAGWTLPLASGSASAAKGVIVEMTPNSKRMAALQAMTLVENIAMLSTLGLFGFVYSAFSNLGKPYLTFYCNAVSPQRLNILVNGQLTP